MLGYFDFLQGFHFSIFQIFLLLPLTATILTYISPSVSKPCQDDKLQQPSAFIQQPPEHSGQHAYNNLL